MIARWRTFPAASLIRLHLTLAALFPVDRIKITGGVPGVAAEISHYDRLMFRHIRHANRTGDAARLRTEGVVVRLLVGRPFGVRLKLLPLELLQQLLAEPHL